jgi:hypothetical protein
MIASVTECVEHTKERSGKMQMRDEMIHLRLEGFDVIELPAGLKCGHQRKQETDGSVAVERAEGFECEKCRTSVEIRKTAASGSDCIERGRLVFDIHDQFVIGVHRNIIGSFSKERTLLSKVVTWIRTFEFLSVWQ